MPLPIKRGRLQFLGEPPDSFKPYYAPYAHLILTHTDPNKMALRAITHSHNGSHFNELVDGQLCLIRLEYLSMDERSRKLYKQLLGKGYNVELILTPKVIDTKLRSTGGFTFQWLEDGLDRFYTHSITVDETVNDLPPKLGELLAAQKQSESNPETVKLKILTKDSDRLTEELASQIFERGGIPYVLVTWGSKGLFLPPYINNTQAGFELPTLRWLNQKQNKDFFIMNTPSSAEWKQLRRDLDSKATPEQQRIMNSIRGDISSQIHYVRKRDSSLHQPRIDPSPDDNGSNFLRRLFQKDTRIAKSQIPMDWDYHPDAGFHWNVALSPSEGLAEDTGFNLEGFGKFLTKILFLDRFYPGPPSRPDSVKLAAVDAFYADMDILTQFYAHQLNQLAGFRIQSKDDRTNLSFLTKNPIDTNDNRLFVRCTMQSNALPGEIMVSPVDNSANGRVYFKTPFYFQGETFSGLQLWFTNGRVIDLKLDHSAISHEIQEKEKRLKSWIIKGYAEEHVTREQWIPGFDHLGEFAIGYNRLISNALKGKQVLDPIIAEKQGVHFALGQAYPSCGGKNKCDYHVDISLGNDENLSIQGFPNPEKLGRFDPKVVIYRGGQFTDEFCKWRQEEFSFLPQGFSEDVDRWITGVLRAMEPTRTPALIQGVWEGRHARYNPETMLALHHRFRPILAGRREGSPV